MAALAAGRAGAEQIRKSPSDRREYRAVELENGLRCVLIKEDELLLAAPSLVRHGSGSGSSSGGAGARNANSREAAATAAVAMSVGVGYLSDPDDVPGLAHFLEHMLFMGTERYPDENSWDSFISQSGGFSNAFTGPEATVFHFDLPLRSLRGALERFSQFFVSPLLKASAASREVSAVNSEFEDRRLSDTERREALRAVHMRRQHPLAKFGWGNRESLETTPQRRGVSVLKHLRAFHDHFYHAEAMRLVVLGADLDALEADVRELFSAVPRKANPIPRFGTAGDPFSPEGVGCLVRIVPVVQQRRVVSLVWSLPDLAPFYQCKPTDYVSSLLGHESAGSALARLKALELASALSSGVEEETSAGWIFSVVVDLTERGLAQLDQVLDILFQHLALVRESGPQEWYWRELQAAEEASFRYQDKVDASDVVVAVAEDLLQYEAPQVLTAPALFEKFDADAISLVLSRLTPERCRVEVVASGFASEAHSVAPYFGTHYSVQRVADATIARWRSFSLSSGGIARELHLPRANEFIPRDFSLCEEGGLGECEVAELRAEPIVAPPEQSAARDAIPLLSPDLASVPESKARRPLLLLDDGASQLWLGHSHKLPTGVIHLEFALPAPASRARHAALLSLWSYLANECILDFAYEAGQAGLNCGLGWGQNSLWLKLTGFTDKLLLLLRRVWATVLAFSVTAEQFRVAREAILTDLRSLYFEPLAQTNYMLSLLLFRSFPPLAAEIEETERATLDDVLALHKTLFLELRCRALFAGNFTPQHALDTLTWMRSVSPWRPFAEERRDVVRVALLERGARRCTRLEQKSLNPAETNAAVRLYVQVGLANEHRCHAGRELNGRLGAPNGMSARKPSESERKGEGGEWRPSLRTLNSLLRHIMAEPLFDKLRTKEQLGYQVSCAASNDMGVLGLTIEVQSARRTPSFLDRRIRAFLASFRGWLTRLSPEAFHRYVRGRALDLARPFNNVYEEASFMWGEISSGRLLFNRLATEIEELKRTTQQHMLEFFDVCLAPHASAPPDAAAAAQGPAERGGAQHAPHHHRHHQHRREHHHGAPSAHGTHAHQPHVKVPNERVASLSVWVWNAAPQKFVAKRQGGRRGWRPPVHDAAEDDVYEFASVADSEEELLRLRDTLRTHEW